MNVMVTGATTPVGRVLINQLLRTRSDGVVLAIGREANPDFPERQGFYYRCADLTHPREVRDLLRGAARSHDIDSVFHGAQHRSPKDAGASVHAQNVTATRELVKGCADHPTIRRLVVRSFAEIYAVDSGSTTLLDEEAPLDFDPRSPQWLRDRVELDVTVCAHLGTTLQIAVLRCAEIFAPDCGSQLWDYLSSRVCLHSLGFDPMINVLSVEDAVAAILAALASNATGIFNIPGADTLPLSRAVAESFRANIPVPGPLLAPLYSLRRRLTGFEFRYDLNRRRLHLGGVMDGTRAETLLGYTPSHPVQWPRPRWRRLLDRLGEGLAS